MAKIANIQKLSERLGFEFKAEANGKKETVVCSFNKLLVTNSQGVKVPLTFSHEATKAALNTAQVSEKFGDPLATVRERKMKDYLSVVGPKFMSLIPALSGQMEMDETITAEDYLDNLAAMDTPGITHRQTNLLAQSLIQDPAAQIASRLQSGTLKSRELALIDRKIDALKSHAARIGTLDESDFANFLSTVRAKRAVDKDGYFVRPRTVKSGQDQDLDLED